MSGESLYKVLGVDSRASQAEVEAAFEEAVAARRSSRRSASDIHASFAVIGDPTLRKAYDLVQLGHATNERLTVAKDAIVEAMPEVRWDEVRQQAWQVTLKTTVLVSGFTARAADVAARVSRGVQAEAAKRIDRGMPVLEPVEEAEQAAD
jgi:hypothetical protein